MSEWSIFIWCAVSIGGALGFLKIVAAEVESVEHALRACESEASDEHEKRLAQATGSGGEGTETVVHAV